MVKPIYYRGDSLNDTINETEKKKSRGLEHSKPMSKGAASFNDNINGFEKDVVDLSTRAKVFIKYKNAKKYTTPPFLAHTGGCAGLVGVDVVMWYGHYEKRIDK